MLDSKKPDNNVEFKCVPRAKLESSSLLSGGGEKTTKTKKAPIRRRHVNNYMNPECTPFTLTLFRLHLFEIFNQQHQKQHQHSSNGDSTVHPAIITLFSNLDANHDSLVDLYEWLARAEIEAAGKCADALFYECDTNDDRRLSSNEINSCFVSMTRPTCAYLRDQDNAVFADQFLKHLSDQLVSDSTTTITLTRRSFAPICDVEGYFEPAQCDNQVTCWCMSKTGEPIVNSLKRISDSQISCTNLS